MSLSPLSSSSPWERHRHHYQRCFEAFYNLKIERLSQSGKRFNPPFGSTNYPSKPRKNLLLRLNIYYTKSPCKRVTQRNVDCFCEKPHLTWAACAQFSTAAILYSEKTLGMSYFHLVRGTGNSL